MKYFLVVLLNIFCISTALAQNNNDSEIEEIIVIGELTSSAVETLIVEVEDEIYRIFNANTEDKDMHFDCQRAVPTGTHLPIRVCEPVFLTKARLENNRDFVASIDTLLSPVALQSELGAEFVELNTAYANLIKESPQFAEVVGILNALRLRLAQLK